MPLADRIKSDLHAALKGGDAFATGVLRYLLAQLHNREIEKKTQGSGGALSDEEAVAVLQKEAKKRKEAAALFTKGGRNDLAEQELREHDVITSYIPAQLSDEEIVKVIDELISRHSDFGALMRETMGRVKGRADGKRVGELVKKRLGAAPQ
jgi:hypothetical protein